MLKYLVAICLIIAAGLPAEATPIRRAFPLTATNADIVSNRSFYVKDGKDYWVYFDFSFRCVGEGKVFVPLPAEPVDFYYDGLLLTIGEGVLEKSVFGHRVYLDENCTNPTLGECDRRKIQSWDSGNANYCQGASPPNASFSTRFSTHFYSR